MNALELARSYGGRIVVIDTETTGLDPSKDEVLSLSIVTANGLPVFDSLIKPQTRKRWPKAQEINGISPADVKGCKTLVEYAEALAPYFDGTYLVVGYNVKFDLKMLSASGLNVSRCQSFDVMREYQKMFGYRVKLVQCATNYGYGVFSAHGSLEDARATAFCFGRLVNDERYISLYVSSITLDRAVRQQASVPPVPAPVTTAAPPPEPKPRSKAAWLLWLLVAIASFIFGALVIAATFTAVTPGGIARGVFWSVLAVAVFVFSVVRLWRK